MGLRMYVSHPEDKDNYNNCYGKCYGYNRGIHLYSLDYLCSISVFEHWNIDCDLWNTRDPGDMREYFSITQSTDAIYLTKEQYKRFILLYKSDQIAIYGNCAEDTFDIGDDPIIKIEWG
jgi:hypothetical protein